MEDRPGKAGLGRRPREAIVLRICEKGGGDASPGAISHDRSRKREVRRKPVNDAELGSI